MNNISNDYVSNYNSNETHVNNDNHYHKTFNNIFSNNKE